MNYIKVEHPPVLSGGCFLQCKIFITIFAEVWRFGLGRHALDGIVTEFTAFPTQHDHAALGAKHHIVFQYGAEAAV